MAGLNVLSTFVVAGGYPLFQSTDQACYRAPALSAAGDGSLLVIVEKRFGYPAKVDDTKAKSTRCSDSGTSDLVIKRSTDRGATWGSEQVIVNHQDLLFPNYKIALAGNPTIIRQDDALILVFLVSKSVGSINSKKCARYNKKDRAKCGVQAEQELQLTRSIDGGISWSKPEAMNFPEGSSRIKTPGPGHGLALASGRLVVPAYPRLLLSDDRGRTWREGATTNGNPLQGGETVIGLLGGNTIWASLRPTGATFKRRGDGRPFRIQAISNDGGESYESISSDKRLAIPPVMPGLAIIGQTWVLSHPVSNNPTNGRAKLQDRQKLTLSVSRDDGVAWTSCLFDPLASGYSDLAQVDSETVAVAYEGGLKPTDDYRAAVKFSVVPVGNGVDVCSRP